MKLVQLILSLDAQYFVILPPGNFSDIVVGGFNKEHVVSLSPKKLILAMLVWYGFMFHST